MPVLTLTQQEREIFARREVLRPSRWAVKHIIVQDGLYAGSPIRMDVAPYMPGILDMYGRRGVEEIIVCGSLQIGKTLILYTCLGWAMDYRPGTKMLTMPTKDTRERVKKEKLLPLLKAQYANDELGVPYTPVELVTDAEAMLERRAPWLPPQAVPHGAIALTCGIDVQKRGYWYLVKAWMPNLSSYVIDYGSLETWEDVARLCADTYYPVLKEGGVPGYAPGMAIPPDSLTGEVLPLWRVGMDSGGTETEGVMTRTEEVYMWIRANGLGVVHACKGASHAQAATVRRVIRERMPHNGRPIPGGLALYMLDTGALKTVAMSRLVNPESAQRVEPPRHLNGLKSIAEYMGMSTVTLGKNTAKTKEYIARQLEADKPGTRLSLPCPGSPFTGRK